MGRICRHLLLGRSQGADRGGLYEPGAEPDPCLLPQAGEAARVPGHHGLTAQGEAACSHLSPPAAGLSHMACCLEVATRAPLAPPLPACGERACPGLDPGSICERSPG